MSWFKTSSFLQSKNSWKKRHAGGMIRGSGWGFLHLKGLADKGTGERHY